MQSNLTILIVLFLISISFQSLGQDSAVKSLHPKMDKYYPRPQKTQVLNTPDYSTPAKPVTNITPAPVMATAPASNNPVVAAAPSVTPTTPAAKEPQSVPTAPAVTSTPVSVEPTNASVSPSDSLSAPAMVTVTAPAQKVVSQPKEPPPPPYMDTRLGSSSPQYNTWEKNNNGAGSVTTQSK